MRRRYDLGAVAAGLGFAALSNNASLSGNEAKEIRPSPTGSAGA
ncbi:hypothetical protein AB0E06_39080 [Streptomyces sp. NPDC048109]